MNKKIYGKWEAVHQTVLSKYNISINFIVIDSSIANCKKVVHLILIEDINANLVFADRAYDTNEVLFYLNKQNIKSVIPPRRNRIYQHDYDYKIYCCRHRH